jgi:hypothetical protein
MRKRGFWALWWSTWRESLRMTSVSSLIRFCGDLERGYAGGGVLILFYIPTLSFSLCCKSNCSWIVLLEIALCNESLFFSHSNSSKQTFKEGKGSQFIKFEQVISNSDRNFIKNWSRLLCSWTCWTTERDSTGILA